MDLWAEAVQNGGSEWDVVGPPQFQKIFKERGVAYSPLEPLHLARSVRFHFAHGLSEWAAGIVDGHLKKEELAAMVDKLWQQGYQIRITRNLHKAKEFLWEKYQLQPDARYGMLTGGRDKVEHPDAEQGRYQNIPCRTMVFGS